MSILSNDVAGADKIDFDGRILAISIILIFSLVNPPHFIIKTSLLMMYLVLRKQYITIPNNTNNINTAIHENANSMTGKIEIITNVITKHIIHTSTFDL